MPENATNEATPSQPAAQTPPGQPSTPADTGVEHRYGSEAPEYLRGKTPAETLAFVNNLVTEVQQLVANRQSTAPPQQQVQMQQYGMPDPDEALTDPKGYQQKLVAYFEAQQNAQLAQAAGPVYQQLATQSREMSRNDPKNAAIWQKYGQAIDNVVANIPAHLRTKELYDEAVIQVKGENFEELAAEKAATLAAAGTGLARAGSDAGDDAGDSGEGDVWAKIEASPMGKAAMNVAGKKGILNAIRQGAYPSLEAYAAAAAKSKAKVDPANPNIVRDYSRR